MNEIKYDIYSGNTVEELKSTKIWKRLYDLNIERAQKAIAFVQFIEPYLNSVHKYFPLYTRHDCHHSFQVLRRMGEITRDELYVDEDNGFTYDELFSLIIAAYAHDVGMVIYEGEKDKQILLKSIGVERINDPKLLKYLRDHHAERGIDFLRQEELKEIIPEYLPGIIGQIMKGHNMHPSELIRTVTRVASLSGQTSNPISLSIILCCADALEFSDTRVIQSAFDEAKNRGDSDAQSSLMEMMKHKAIGCGISITKEGLLVATGEFKDGKVLHSTHKALNQIEVWLKEYLYYDKLESRQVLKLSNNTIYRDSFTTDNFSYHPVAIKLDEYQIREILTSKNMWGNSESLPIKEIIQNSIDACRYREYVKPKHIAYEPKIEVIVNYEDSIIGIHDNGIGMSEEDIINYFLQIGKSKTRTSNFKENPINVGFSSLARYGIGFWSVFSIANEAEIKTKFDSFYEKKSGVKFDVRINPLKSFLELRDSNIKEGTQINIKLKKEIDLSKIIEELVRAITVSNIECRIVDVKGDILYEYPRELKKIAHKDIFGYRTEEAIAKGIEVFSFKKQNYRLEVSMGIAYSKIEGEYRCLGPDGNSMFAYMPYNMGVGGKMTTSVCGLSTVFSIGPIPLAIERVGTMLIDIKDPEGLEFSLSRRTLMENEGYNKVRNEIIEIISEGLSQFYEHLNIENDPKKIQILINDSRSNGGEAGDTCIPKLYDFYTQHYKDLVPLELLYWRKGTQGVQVAEKNIMLQDFWEIDSKVYYACIWPERGYTTQKKNFIHALINSVNDIEGYILWAYQEANSLVEVANGVKVMNMQECYFDWNTVRNEVIVIDPSKGYQLCDKNLLHISSRWSGNIVSLPFARMKGERPWYNFGRYIMYVDKGHPLIQYIIKLSNSGKIWECGDLLALMSSNDRSVNEELQKRIGIVPVY